MTNAHVEIIKELKKETEVRVMPVVFMKKDKEVNSKSFPFSFELRKKMLQAVFDDSILILPNYTFYSPFAKYMPPLLSPFSWNIKDKILDGISEEYFTYTGDRAEGFVLRLYGLNPRIGTRKTISASFVREKMFEEAPDNDTDWEKCVPQEVVKIIRENWQIVKKYSVEQDDTYKILGMKFPRDGFW